MVPFLFLYNEYSIPWQNKYIILTMLQKMLHVPNYTYMYIFFYMLHVHAVHYFMIKYM